MKTEKILTIGAIAAFTAFVPAIHAVDADADVKIKTDVNRPKAEAQAELKTDRDRDLTIRTDKTTDTDREKVQKENKASGILGMEVRNSNNEKLGEIKDLVMDLNSGKVSYSVLAVGGFLGIGEKLLAIPPSALSVAPDHSHLILNADRAKIEAAPGFAATSWPSVHNPDINKYWGTSEGLGAPARTETSRDRSLELNRDKKIDVDVDADTKGDKKKLDVDVDTKRDGKIYTDADKDKKVKIDIDKD